MRVYVPGVSEEEFHDIVGAIEDTNIAIQHKTFEDQRSQRSRRSCVGARACRAQAQHLPTCVRGFSVSHLRGTRHPYMCLALDNSDVPAILLSTYVRTVVLSVTANSLKNGAQSWLPSN